MEFFKVTATHTSGGHHLGEFCLELLWGEFHKVLGCFADRITELKVVANNWSD